MKLKNKILLIITNYVKYLKRFPKLPNASLFQAIIMRQKFNFCTGEKNDLLGPWS